MDTLTSSVSSLNLPSLPPPTTRERRRLTTTTNKPTPTKSIFTQKPTSCPPPSSSSTSTYLTRKSANFQPPIFSTSSKPAKSRHTHKSPATGYAAALINVTQSKGCLGKAQEDVRRLSLFLDEFHREEEKLYMVKEVAQRGKLGKYVMGLVTMLVEKGKVGILGEILNEFERIYEELVGTNLVWVSSRKKMKDDALFEIAKRVQKKNGGTVKVMNIVDDSLPAAIAM